MGTNSGQPIDPDVDSAQRQQGTSEQMHGQYGVSFVTEDALPKGVDWVFIEVDGTLYFAIKREHVTAEALAEAWGAFRSLEAPADG